MSSFPVSTHATESAVLAQSPEQVWARISSLNFDWWNLVSGSEPVEGGSNTSVGSLFNVSIEKFIPVRSISKFTWIFFLDSFQRWCQVDNPAG